MKRSIDQLTQSANLEGLGDRGARLLETLCLAIIQNASPQARGDAEHQRNVVSLTECLPSRLNIEFILGRRDELIADEHGVLVEERALNSMTLR